MRLRKLAPGPGPRRPRRAQDWGRAEGEARDGRPPARAAPGPAPLQSRLRDHSARPSRTRGGGGKLSGEGVGLWGLGGVRGWFDPTHTHNPHPTKAPLRRRTRETPSPRAFRPPENPQGAPRGPDNPEPRPCPPREPWARFGTYYSKTEGGLTPYPHPAGHSRPSRKRPLPPLGTLALPQKFRVGHPLARTLREQRRIKTQLNHPPETRNCKAPRVSGGSGEGT